MRLLIDGYNVMYAGGLLGKRFGPDGFRKARSRFLADVAGTLGPVEAYLTTVVFDASVAHDDRPTVTRHNGIEVIYAVNDENADARIEELISKHSSPKLLTVVSSDLRVRTAASRRKTKLMTADQFWVDLATRKQILAHPKSPPVEPPARQHGLNEQESRYWQKQFADVTDMPEVRQALNQETVFLTDEEIAQLEREIEQEL